jgi:hypothetical protein
VAGGALVTTVVWEHVSYRSGDHCYRRRCPFRPRWVIAERLQFRLACFWHRPR